MSLYMASSAREHSWIVGPFSGNEATLPYKPPLRSPFWGNEATLPYTSVGQAMARIGDHLKCLYKIAGFVSC